MTCFAPFHPRRWELLRRCLVSLPDTDMSQTLVGVAGVPISIIRGLFPTRD